MIANASGPCEWKYQGVQACQGGVGNGRADAVHMIKGVPMCVYHSPYDITAEDANVVTVNGKEYEIPAHVANELREAAPHPHNVFPGGMGRAMLRRQAVTHGCAADLGIELKHMRDVVRQLRSQLR